MNQQNMSLDDESVNLLLNESSKLKQTLDIYTKKIEEVSMTQIVELYYQVINVNSLVTYCENLNYNQDSNINAEIINIKKIIQERFNNDLHRLILNKIDNLIKVTKNNLREIQKMPVERTKEEIEKQAENYEELRKMISTKEFVKQYNKLINKS